MYKAGFAYYSNRTAFLDILGGYEVCAVLGVATFIDETVNPDGCVSVLRM
jgi:hypothetical protein